MTYLCHLNQARDHQRGMGDSHTTHQGTPHQGTPHQGTPLEGVPLSSGGRVTRSCHKRNYANRYLSYYCVFNFPHEYFALRNFLMAYSRRDFSILLSYRSWSTGNTQLLLDSDSRFIRSSSDHEAAISFARFCIASLFGHRSTDVAFLQYGQISPVCSSPQTWQTKR